MEYHTIVSLHKIQDFFSYNSACFIMIYLQSRCSRRVVWQRCFVRTVCKVSKRTCCSMCEFPYIQCYVLLLYFICIFKHNSHQKRNQKTHCNQKFSDSIRNFLIPSLPCSRIPNLLLIICKIWNQKFSDSSENF